MSRRLLFLIGLCLIVGVATSAFGEPAEQAPWIQRDGAVAQLIESKPAWKAEVVMAGANPEPLPLYVDTHKDGWYVPYLEVAFKKGLIEATDFQRKFRPGELLKQGEAIALAVRYKANGDQSKLPQEEPDHPLSIPLHVQAAYDMGLKLPNPLHTWDVIRRSDWIALMESAGVPHPGEIVVDPPKAATATANPAPVQQLPVTGPAPVVTQPVVVQPVVTQPTTGFKPVEAPVQQPVYTQPTYVAPIQAQPTYVPNPPNSRPVSSGDDVGEDFGSYPSPADPNDGYFAIAVPSLGINDLKISHPTDVNTQQGLLAPLQYGVGHLFSYPGNGGTVLVYGHSSSTAYDVSEFTKIFRKINALKPGDKVYIAYQGKTFEYEVTYSQTVAATDMSAYQKNNGEELILYTCWPPDDVKQRYLVHAKPV